MQTNGLRDSSQIRPGQRLVIPRYMSRASTQDGHPLRTPRRRQVSTSFSTGETLMSIARRNGVTADGAGAAQNHLQASSKLSVGDRISVPRGNHQVAAVHPSATPQAAPQVAQQRAVPLTKSCERRTRPELPTSPRKSRATTEAAVKTAEPAGAMPAFRWPVRGRVIAGFGSKPNGTQNDGINLAVPEGTPIKAADDGVVAYAGNELKGYGNLVLIRHSNGFVSAYAHAKRACWSSAATRSSAAR